MTRGIKLIIIMSVLAVYCYAALTGGNISAAAGNTSVAAGNTSGTGSDSLQNRGKVVIVVVDRITWDDLIKADVPEIRNLALRGATGLMTTNPAAGSPRLPVNTYATIGSGAKVRGGPSGSMAFNTSEEYENDTAVNVFRRRTGIKGGIGQVLHLGIIQMERNNFNLKYEYALGAIGTALHRNGLKTAVLGNADIPDNTDHEKVFGRMAATIAMDDSGQVDYGNVSTGLYRRDALALAGISTDFAVLFEEFVRASDRADLIVVETGDTSRVEEMRAVASDKVLTAQRHTALNRVDRFVGKIVQTIDLNKDLLMIIVPGPTSETMEQGNFLTPFVMTGRGVERGVVWTGTVKRRGLITNTDIAPTVMGYFGLPPVIEREGALNAVLNGQVVKSLPGENAFDEITELESDAVFLNKARAPLVRNYLNIELAIIILTAAAIFLKLKAAKYLVPVLTALTVFPLVMLWASFLPRPSITVAVAEVIGATLIIALILAIPVRRFPMASYLVVTGITALMIIIDLILESPLGKTSPFSYDAMAGARFYGIGNEYMGVLLGCILVFTGLLLDALKVRSGPLKVLVLTMLVAVTYVMAAPGLGTNAGGTIAAVAGTGATAYVLYGGRIKARTVFAVSAAGVLIIAVFMAYDLTRVAESQSHIGRTVSLIRENGFSEIINIISRKWAVNYKLLRNTTWSWFFFTSLLTIYLLGRKVPSASARFKANYPWFNRFLTGVLFAALFALVFNDSGIVAAATMITFAVAPYLAGLIIYREEMG